MLVLRMQGGLVRVAAGEVLARGNATAAVSRLREQTEQGEQPALDEGKKALQTLLGQLEAHEVRIPVPWGHVAGKWWGPRDRRPLIALHGWGDNAGSFQRLASFLRGIPVLALDLPGHGFSSRVPRGAAPAERIALLHMLRRVQRALNLPRVSLVGHSAGDALALLYAASFPTEVDLFISFDPLSPAPLHPDAEVKTVGGRVDALLEAEDELALQRKLPVTSREDLLQALLAARSGSLNRHAAEILSRRGAAVDPRLAGPRPSLLTVGLALSAARNVRCPMLTVIPQWRAPRALSADPELRERALDEIRMASKSLTTVTVDGTHHVHLNNPEVVIPAVDDFLREHRKGEDVVSVPIFSV